MERKARGMSAADTAIPAFVAAETPLCGTAAGAPEMPGGDATGFLVLKAMVKLFI